MVKIVHIYIIYIWNIYVKLSNEFFFLYHFGFNTVSKHLQIKENLTSKLFLSRQNLLKL